MRYEKSCGALVFRQDPRTGRRYVLMIRHKHGGHRSFPKGHVEAGETEHETAIREVEEETAVRIRITSDFCEKVHYSPMPGVSKEVVYFLSVTDQKATHPHDGEIADVEWVPLENAERSLTHENDKIGWIFVNYCRKPVPRPVRPGMQEAKPLRRLLRHCRAIPMVQLRSRIFRQTIQKFAGCSRATDKDFCEV